MVHFFTENRILLAQECKIQVRKKKKKKKKKKKNGDLDKSEPAQSFDDLIPGAIFTAVGVLEVLTQLVSNVATSAIYSATVSYMRGLVFLVLGSYNAISLILTL